MLYDKDIARLKAQLSALGFEDGLESLLRSELCFQPAQFCLIARIEKGPDTVAYLLQFILNEAHRYECKFYDAILRKQLNIESGAALDKQMKAIDWSFTGVATAEQAEAIDAVVTELKKMDATADQRETANLLRFKYWSGTAAEPMIPQFSFLKSRYEVSQRFYFFDTALPITSDEAYRFLSNRCLEKQAQFRKKQQDATVQANVNDQEIALQPKKKAKKS